MYTFIDKKILNLLEMHFPLLQSAYLIFLNDFN